MGYLESIYVLTAINVIISFGLYWTLQTGQMSVGHGAFMGIGAYVSGALSVKLGWPFFASVATGAVVAAAVGILVGAIALRLRTLYLAMATLGFGEIVRVFFLTNEYFGAAEGMGGMVGTTTLIVTVSVVILLLVAWLIHHSRLGLALRAVRLDEEAASLTGLPTTFLKVQAFGFGALITGFGGALFAHYLFFIDPEQIGFERSILILMIVVLGGAGHIWGPVIGSIVFTFLPEGLRYLDLAEWRMVIFAVIIVLLMLIRPQGLVDRHTFQRLRFWTTSKQIPRLSFIRKSPGSE